MNRTLFTSRGGRVDLPGRRLVLVDRQDGGNLVVVPPREVWDRSELTADELAAWSFLVAATAQAMLHVLPQLQGGCINYWDAGNWALNEQAEPRGPKTGRQHRSVHLHLLGRSATAGDPSWRWGEAPTFPDYSHRLAWAAGFEPLTADECRKIVARTDTRLRTHYRAGESDIAPWSPCATCGYPTPHEPGPPRQVVCTECLK